MIDGRASGELGRGGLGRGVERRRNVYSIFFGIFGGVCYEVSKYTQIVERESGGEGGGREERGRDGESNGNSKEKETDRQTGRQS